MKKKVVILIIFIIGINCFAYQNISDTYSLDKDLINQISSTIPNYTEIDKIPQDLINAIVVIEDKDFFKHHGFDVVGIGRAFVTDIKEGKIVEGGSTITQQLAKNLFLSSDKKLTRKLKELVLAIKLENIYSKEEILEMYVNVIYFGSGAYGIQDASQTYFNKNVEDLTLADCTVLAGLPQAPGIYNPNKYPDRAKKRQEVVLAMMYKNGLINKKTEQLIKQQTVEN